MKVVAYVGSMRGKNSTTYKIVSKFIGRLEKKIKEKVDSHIFCANDISIEMCKGCMQCYEKGCYIRDDIKLVMEEIMKADIVILGSPVYVHQVTGPMKNLIDRLSTWCYLLPLIGKIGVTVSVSNTNGNSFVDFYLNKILDIWGASIAGNISIQKYPESKEEELIDEVVKNVINCIDDKEKRFKISERQRILFQNYKNVFEKADDSYLKKHWTKRGYFNYKTLQDMVEDIKRNN